MGIAEFIQGLTVQVMSIAWLLFLITWVIGWAIKGSPIPIHRVKRTGQSLVEDAVLAAFWMALGSSIFALISYITSSIYQPMPPPPQP
ncbi:MAG: hypothetical protein B6U73_04035 [Desulfurococcales archaeon ex4484_204]|nr:MAG: hypothetical protein B6U73_04035 [Desulfurococcales archaeon ex4484_204]